jgi:hypothetical protein
VERKILFFGFDAFERGKFRRKNCLLALEHRRLSLHTPEGSFSLLVHVAVVKENCGTAGAGAMAA